MLQLTACTVLLLERDSTVHLTVMFQASSKSDGFPAINKIITHA